MPSYSPYAGILLKLASTIAFTAMAAGVKWLSESGLPTGQLVFCRSFFALIPLVIWLAWLGQWPAATRTTRLGAHLKRGLIGSCGMISGFSALAFLPLPDATAYSYATPLIVVILAAILLKEEVRIYRWSAVLIGFIGVLVMLWPKLQGMSAGAGLSLPVLGAMLSLVGATCAGFATIEVRRLTQTETTGAIVFYFMLLTSAISVLTILLGWRWPTPFEAVLLVLIGVLGGIGQILLTQSFQKAETSLVAPYEYATMLWAVMLGYMLFGDVPGPSIVIGALIVVGAGLFVIWREHRLGLERRRAQEAAPPRSL